VTLVGLTVVGPERRSSGLRWNLRTATRDWHSRVEGAADLPASIATRADYVDLLGRLYDLHAGFESWLAEYAFDEGWRRVGVDISRHRRAYLLAADLGELGTSVTSDWAPSPPLPTFGHALGCLYVLEGSSLGGRTVARVVRAVIGEVPTTFLTGVGRPEPAPWAVVCRALELFEALGGDGDAVISGACETFAAFADGLGSAAAPGTTQAASTR
jgi:heme oxygenase (biliverdin-IX-beta and delta-forming)